MPPPECIASPPQSSVSHKSLSPSNDRSRKPSAEKSNFVNKAASRLAERADERLKGGRFLTKMALKITEEWIKERIQLDHDKLGENFEILRTNIALEAVPEHSCSAVQSASARTRSNSTTGTVHRILCKRATTLQKMGGRLANPREYGLTHLKYLETLNLYYNQIPDLKEVFKLRKNQNLKVLDLRLNPVTKTEPDYRLFVVHMLPQLRTLDDRPVRESERKSALMHFSNEQAAEMDKEELEFPEPTEKKEVRTSSQPRAEYVRNMIKKPTFVTEEDTCMDVIDLMNRNGGDVRNERAPTGGVRTDPEVEDHTHAELVRLAQKDDFSKKRRHFKPQEDMNGYMNGHDAIKRTELPYKPRLGSGSSSSVSSKKSAPVRDEYPFENEDEAYTKYKSVANFTRHPGTDAPPPTVGPRLTVESCSSQSSIPSMTSERDEYSSLPNVKRLSFGDSGSSKPDESMEVSCSVQSKFIEEFLDLVDRYWNGTKSLHYHKKFKSLIEKPLARYEEGLSTSREIQIRALQDKVATLTTENKNLHVKIHSLSKQKSSSTQDGASQKEQDALRSRLQLSMSDNKILRSKISELEEKLCSKEDEKGHHDNDQMMELERQKRSLVQQVANMKFQMKNYESLDDLTKMLQESHKSLISTNDRLLSELDETRSRHQSEVEQLKWSYDQLRKTSHLLGSTGTSNGHDSSHTNGY